MWSREVLKMRGKAAFNRNYWSCVAVAFIMAIIAGFSAGTGSIGNNINTYQTTTTQHQDGIHVWEESTTYYDMDSLFDTFGMMMIMLVLVMSLITSLLYIFVGNVLTVSGKRFFLLNQTGRPGAGIIGSGFKSGHYKNIVLVMFLEGLYVFLWTLLLIVPGIIKTYEYRMIPYILAENPGMDRKSAFAISKRMMMGQKMETFILDLSFIGWGILSFFTCGILGIFYVSPYKEATYAEQYAFNRMQAYNEGYIR